MTFPGETNLTCRRTDSLIGRLIRMTWSTALPPTLCIIVNMICFVKLSLDGNDQVYIVFNLMMPKLYSLSLMYTLNSYVES